MCKHFIAKLLNKTRIFHHLSSKASVYLCSNKSNIHPAQVVQEKLIIYYYKSTNHILKHTNTKWTWYSKCNAVGRKSLISSFPRIIYTKFHSIKEEYGLNSIMCPADNFTYIYRTKYKMAHWIEIQKGFSNWKHATMVWFETCVFNRLKWNISHFSCLNE